MCTNALVLVLFGRRDSFITHRAFCDALAQESARQLPTGLNPLGGPHLYGPPTNTGLGLSQVGHHLSPLQADHHLPSDLLRLGGAAVSSQFDHLLPPAPSSSAAFRPPYLHPSSSAFFVNSGGHGSSFHHDHGHNAPAGADGLKPFHGLLTPPNLPAATSGAAGLFNMSFFSNTTTGTSPAGPLLINDHLSGAETSTTLFSGAVMADHHLGAGLYTSEPLPQMSATALLQKAAQMGATTSMRSSLGGSNVGAAAAVSKQDHLQDLMNSLANGGSSHVFMGGSDGMTTRDFLGVGGGMVRASINGGGTAMADHHIGLDMSSLDSDMKSKAGGLRPFGGASLH